MTDPVMADERSWKPDVKTLASWGDRSNWRHRYFEWLRGQNPLPVFSGSTQIADAYRPLFAVLTAVHALDERRLADFHAGKFSSLSMAEDYDYRYEDERIDEEKKAIEYRQIIRDLMTGTWDVVTDADVDNYVRRLEAKRPYGGPRA